MGSGSSWHRFGSADPPRATRSRARASSGFRRLCGRSPSTANRSARTCSSRRACASGERTADRGLRLGAGKGGEMFTGLIADLGTVLSLAREGDGARLRIGTHLASELDAGASVAVNGVCLTATHVDGDSFAADAMSETLRRTSLGTLHEGARVNLELPLRAGDRLGGHVVQGHVDAAGTVRALREEGLSRVLTIEAPAEVAK